MLLQHNYSYRTSFEASLKVNWEVRDLIGEDKPLNFSKPFLPESLARVESLSCLSEPEKLLLNQIRGNSYLYIFGFVEEFILPFVLDHVRTRVHGDDYEMRSLLQFAQEEAKHIHLFKEFAKAFEAGFGTHCQVIGPAEQFAQAVLEKSPLGVVLAILEIEWMTQRHYLDSVRDDRGIDPQFASLLKHHWMEEAQHAKLDTLIAEALAERATQSEIAQGIADYLAIGGMIDSGLQQQVEFDITALEKASGRPFNEPEKQQLRQVQQGAYRYTFLTSGMTHPNFVGTLEQMSPPGAAQVADLVQVLS
jgi:predicted metal-dependent hydrolase